MLAHPELGLKSGERIYVLFSLLDVLVFSVGS